MSNDSFDGKWLWIRLVDMICGGYKESGLGKTKA